MLHQGLYGSFSCIQQYIQLLWRKLLPIFEENNLHTEGNTVPIPTPLCKGHYHTVYFSVQPQQTNCATCGMSLKHVRCRPCPNAEVVGTHLRNSAGYEGNLSNGDKVCYSCYKSHLILLQEEKKVSEDSDLQSTIANIRHSLSTATTPSTLQQMRDLAMDKIVVYVGEELLQRKVILLLVVHQDVFMKSLLKVTCKGQRRHQ